MSGSRSRAGGRVPEHVGGSLLSACGLRLLPGQLSPFVYGGHLGVLQIYYLIFIAFQFIFIDLFIFMCIAQKCAVLSFIVKN